MLTSKLVGIQVHGRHHEPLHGRSTLALPASALLERPTDEKCRSNLLSHRDSTSQAHRGIPISQTYLSTGSTSSASTALKPRVSLIFSLPLSSIITTFHSNLKSISSGFASFDYEEAPYEVSDLVRMNILVSGQKIDALCTVVHRSQVQKEGRDWAARLREAIPRQQHEVVIQAAVGTNILARERYVDARGVCSMNLTCHVSAGSLLSERCVSMPWRMTWLRFRALLTSTTFP